MTNETSAIHREETLRTLLGWFSADEFRRWISLSPYRDIASSLPGDVASLYQLIDDALAILERQGRLNAAFLTEIARARPHRSHLMHGAWVEPAEEPQTRLAFYNDRASLWLTIPCDEHETLRALIPRIRAAIAEHSWPPSVPRPTFEFKLLFYVAATSDQPLPLDTPISGLQLEPATDDATYTYLLNLGWELRMRGES